jgi:hypothetical protein
MHERVGATVCASGSGTRRGTAFSVLLKIKIELPPVAGAVAKLMHISRP